MPGACRYVEDTTNKLVRTFTGNLTAMLHQVHSVRSNFDAVRSLASSSSGGSRSGSGRSRLSMMAGATSGVSHSSSADGSVQGVEQAVSRLSQVSTSSSLVQSMSLPMQSKSVKQLWLKKVEQAIEEQASGASAAMESTGSNSSDQLQSASEEQQDELTGAAAGFGAPKGGLAARAAKRRSSRSGGKVLGLADGLEVAACTTPSITE